MGICGSKSAKSGSKAGGGASGKTITAGGAGGNGTAAGGFSRSNFILENAGVLTNFYDVEEKKLGQGSYGSVSKGVNKMTKQIRAVKTIAKARLKNIESFKQEVSIMKSLDHPNIIRLFETFEDHRNVYLVMELCTGGELFDRVLELGHLTEVQAAIIMQQILRAVFYLHENKIVHRDLKPENFLFLDKLPVEKAILKIIDFGLSTRFEDGQMLSMKAGTPYYVAPQVLQGRYDKACDLWSCGVIMYILLCGYPPFHGETDADVLTKVRLGNFTFNNADWKNISEDAKDLVRKLLKMNPKERYTADQALNHLWVKNKAPRAQNVPLESTQLENLRNFKVNNRLKKAALQVIAQQLPDSEIENLKKIFMSIDKNGDGQLTVQEMVEGLHKSGMQTIPEELAELMKGVDADGSGVIDYTEFIAATLDKRKYIQEDRLWAAFRVFDTDGSGKITKQELQQVLAGGKLDDMAKKNIDEIMKECDTDGDGEIDFEEFVAMMRKN